jgi:midasin
MQSLIVVQVFAAHADLCTRVQLSRVDELMSVIDSQAQEPKHAGVSSAGEVVQHQGSHFQRILETFLIPCVNILQCHLSGNQDINQLAKAWVMFAVGCLLLYVPSRQFDPFVRAATEAEIRNLRKDAITRKLDAFQLVEISLTGQKSNPRCDMLEKELQSLGEELMVPRVVRPEVSEMDQLQNEFSNILSSIIEPFQDRQFFEEFISGRDFFREKLITLRLNALEVAKRLRVGYRAYDDLTFPIIGFLGCIDLGLSLMAASRSSPDQCAIEVDHICTQTPLLSAKTEGLLVDFLRQEDADTLTSRIRYLRWLAIVRKVQGLQSFGYLERKKFVGVVRNFYEEWKKRLSLEQKKTAVKSSLYRYQGNAEDEESIGQAELEDLFPIESSPSRNDGDVHEAETPQAITQQLATLHSAIFREDADAPLLILQLLEYAANSIGNQTFPQNFMPGTLYSVENVLPSVMVSLDRTASSVAAGAHDASRYDFYRDPNIKEVERLLDIVRRIRFRFSELRNVWPEHMTLQDVVTTCEEVVQFACGDPLSKVLTKAEKLHSQLHEWQLVASKEVACNEQYDELVSIIVGWRRLELLTWARLFDFEKRKCEDETNQWFFMAYEIVVAMPLSLLESGEGLGGVTANLASVLEAFSTTTTLGQFSTRLQMLRELNEHVLLIARDSEGMLPIHRSLASMINFQNSFKPQIDQALSEGTQALEKDIKDVILLASWKDTNINALRESARRSHVKLLNVVRKYRALLSRPVTDYVRLGLPTISLSDITPAPQLLLPEPPCIDQAVGKLFQAMLPNWSERPQRLVNIGSTVQKMNTLGQALLASTSLSQSLEAFVSELTSSMKELQEQTPSTASDENKDLLAHLKTRKRKLFAETLRGVRRMGFQYNLSTDILSAQSSLAAVLTRTPPFPAANDIDDTDNTDFVFHRLLELMPRIRQATRDHSCDLTRDEVNRSVGHLEGILHFLLRQREAVVEGLARTIAFKDALQTCSGLCATEAGQLEGITVQSVPDVEGFGRCITWLPHILEATHQILKIHNRLADIDGTTLEDFLASWKQRFSELLRRERLLPLVPEAIVTSDHMHLRKDAENSLTELRASLNKWSIEQPLYRYIIKQVLLWTEPLSMDTYDSTENRSNTNDLSVQAVEEALSTICDKSLVALQEMKQEAGAQGPSSHERNWLIRHDEKVAALMRASHSSQLVSNIQAWAKTLRYLAKQELRIAAVLFNMARPILQQYADILVSMARSYSAFHRSNCTLAYILARAFSTLAQKGYCAPDETSKTQDGTAEQVENGTGLGEGEAAEDISKDVDAESLPDIAQEPNQSAERQEMEHEIDAVEMADGMDGQVDDASQENEREASDASDASDNESEMDERVDGVDDLDPTAVDEKFWDGKDDAEDKNQTSDKARGKGKKDEQVAAADTEQPGNDDTEGGDESEGDFPEEDEHVRNEEPQKQDEYTQEGTTLDLPEEMALDGEKQPVDQEDGDLDDDITVNEKDELDHVEEEEDHNPASSDSDDQPISEAGSLDHAEDDMPEEKSTSREPSPHANERNDEVSEDIQELSIYDAENEAGEDNGGPSVARGAAGSRQTQDESMQQQHEPEANGEVDNSAGAESGSGIAEEHEGTMSPKRRLPESSSDAKSAEAQQTINEPQAQAFRKLGDVLKNWQRQYRRIQEASERPEDDDSESRPIEKPAAVEHLQNEEDMPDAQALGAATEEQAHALDQRGVSGLAEQEVNGFLDDDKEGDAQSNYSPDPMDVDEPNDTAEPSKVEGSPKHPQGLIGEYNPVPEDGLIEAKDEASEDIESKNIEASALEPDNSSLALPSLRDASDAQALWARYENDTRALSLLLTEQLRLILSPTVARKMRGDFRTGKRLNIRRIIPYIASQYRRDKIWLRRAQPSARRYQILLAVDDSKSMADGAGAAGQLALATLAMVARSLALLEAGQLCVVAFGAEVRVAHDFDTPFDAAAGAAVFRHFGFRQTRTDVRALLERSLALFRAARLSAAGGGSSSGGEPWQLQLIISDGVCEDHAAIRRLVRQAREERIMIVFIIVDDVGGGNSGGGGGESKGSGGGGGGKRSILEMRQATFETPAGDNGSGSGSSGGGGGGNGMLKVRMQRYLDTFPFPFYVVVGDVQALPGVLATALRQWFREVVDAGI